MDAEPAELGTRRADARRNVSALLDAAAELFVDSGVDVPVRRIASRAGVTTATIYRHFPTRADLILSVYRRQVDALVRAGRSAVATADAGAALGWWVDLFVDFLVTKRGMAKVLQSDEACYDPLHSFFLENVQPAFAELLGRTVGPSVDGDDDARAHTVLHTLAAICSANRGEGPYDSRHLCRMLITGLQAASVGARPSAPA